jgi:outer membrane protein TolC
VDAVAFYGGSGQAGVQNPFLAPGVVDAPIAPTGFMDAFRQSFNGSSPDYAVGIQMTIPIRNRAAQADQVRSELEYRQAELRYQQLQNQIRIEVQNAQFAVTQNRARVESARKARDLAQRTYDIEQKKLVLGASTSLTLLETGRDLALAESNLVSAMTTYEKSRVELDRVIGSTLEHNGISMEDAELGHVKNAPVIPGVTGMEK